MEFEVDFIKGDIVPEYITSAKGVEIIFNLDCKYLHPAITPNFKAQIIVDGFIYNRKVHGKLFEIKGDHKNIELEIDEDIFKMIFNQG